MRQYSLGLDFGTESVRALAVDCHSGEEGAEAIEKYPEGVISPGADIALQNPLDYLSASIRAIKEVLEQVPAREIIGIGVDFTSCTILPTSKEGTPLMTLSEFAGNHHAWVKLWKHHAAQDEADRINLIAKKRNESFLKYYQATVSCEWMLPKCLEIARKSPQVYEAAHWILDAGDWIVQQMTGVFSRSSCSAGYKGLWNAENGFPSRDFLKAVDPRIENLGDKWITAIANPGDRVGGISRSFAQRSGLVEGTPVSAAVIDAHSGVVGMGVHSEGLFSIMMGTSSCHMVLSHQLKFFEGIAGVVRNGILPGFYGYESGQPAVGDSFNWFVETFSAAGTGQDRFGDISEKASKVAPGSSGLVTLDWMNGNRSVLMNSHLSGAILGLTLQTKPEEIYRSLIEATAFGSRKIMENYIDSGIPLHEAVVCGGLTRDPLIMQIYADVLGVPIRVATSKQAVALGAAVFGALAAGKLDMEEAICRMTKPSERVYRPDADAQTVYSDLYGIYLELHDHFGRTAPELMKRLKSMKSQGVEK